MHVAVLLSEMVSPEEGVSLEDEDEVCDVFCNVTGPGCSDS